MRRLGRRLAFAAVSGAMVAAGSAYLASNTVAPSSAGETEVSVTQSAVPTVDTFSYTGHVTSFTVPAGVTSVTITAEGAGGGGADNTSGGSGASETGTFKVTPGET
ncbi:MAG: hypothetical protein ACRDXC_01415, partial [Acidimicrobiales bacterium]